MLRPSKNIFVQTGVLRVCGHSSPRQIEITSGWEDILRVYVKFGSS